MYWGTRAGPGTGQNDGSNVPRVPAKYQLRSALHATYYWTNLPYPIPYSKYASCDGSQQSWHNEARLYSNTYYMSQTSYHYAGTEFEDLGYSGAGLATAGESNHDTYGCTLCKEWHGKWYFEADGTLHQ